MGQWLSLPMVVVGALILMWSYRRSKTRGAV
jgi:prolipoprotein diacylglyceryltransferase